MIKNTFFVLLAATVFALSPAKSPAQSMLSLDDVAKVTLVPGWRTNTGTHMAGIRISLAEGWKTYWRSAGEGGIPGSFDWSASGNLEDVQIHWPRPTVFVTRGLRSFGYTDVVVIPIELTPGSDASGSIQLRGRMDLGVCQDICIPMSVDLQGSLSATGSPNSAINKSLANRPKDALRAGVGSVICTVEPISDGLRLSVQIELPRQGGDEVAVVELPDRSIWIDEAQTERRGRILSAVTDLVPAENAPFFLNRSEIRITVLGKNAAVDIQGCTGS